MIVTWLVITIINLIIGNLCNHSCYSQSMVMNCVWNQHFKLKLYWEKSVRVRKKKKSNSKMKETNWIVSYFANSWSEEANQRVSLAKTHSYVFFVRDWERKAKKYLMDEEQIRKREKKTQKTRERNQKRVREREEKRREKKKKERENNKKWYSSVTSSKSWKNHSWRKFKSTFAFLQCFSTIFNSRNLQKQL